MHKDQNNPWRNLKVFFSRLLRHRSSLLFPRIIFTFSFIIFASLIFREFVITARMLGWEKQLWWGLSVMAGFFIVLAGFIYYFEYYGIGPQEGIYRRAAGLKAVALTFDDGPNPVYTARILDVLKEKKVKATFFVVGRHVLKYPEVAQRIISEGHEIGNHTHTHRDLVPTTRRVVENQIKKAEKAILDVCGVLPKVIRPPRGIYSNNVRKIMLELGYKIVLWSVSTQDWRSPSPEQILNRVKRWTRDGDIILFHDSGALVRREGASRGSTVKALPLVIDYLSGEGFELMTAGELFGFKEIESAEHESVKKQPCPEELKA